MKPKLISGVFLLFFVFSQAVVLGQTVTPFSITNSSNSLSVPAQTGASYQWKKDPTWGNLGTAGFSASQAESISLALDGNGTPYVAYKDYINNNKLTVKKLNGSSWETVGSVGFSTGVVYAEFNSISLALDGNGTPYVAYKDQTNSNKATVMKLNGAIWETVGGNAVSAGNATAISLALDGKGTPYVAYTDGTINKATVMKFNGTSWQTVGTTEISAGSSSTPSLAMDGNGTPYVAYVDGANGSKATVKKLNGTTWETVGNAGFSAGIVYSTSLALDGNGTPYLAYEDGANSSKATVMKLNGTSWQTVGNAGFTAGTTWYLSLALDGSGTPYVAYADFTNGLKAMVMKFNGTSWKTVGTAGPSAGAAYYTSLALNGSGIPYVAYQDQTNSNKATVKKFDGGTVGTNSINYTATSGGVYMAATTIGTKGALSLNSIITPAVSISSSDSDNIICQGTGTSITFTATATDTGGGTVAYQWKEGSTNVGTNSSTYTTNTLADATAVSCVITIIGGVDLLSDTATSGTITISNTANIYITPTFAAVKPICSGTTLTALPTSSIDGITGTWSPALNNTATTVYTFTPTAGQCATTTTLTIGVTNCIDPFSITNSNNNLAVPAQTGASYQWKKDPTWSDLGTAGFSAGIAENTSLALDGSGTPYVAYRDFGNASKATVKKFDGTSWQTVGNAGFSAAATTYTSLALDGSGTPYVAYTDGGNGSKATVMKLNGSSWQIVGTAGFSEGSVDYTSLALDGNGTPYVAYKDGGNNYKATVKKFNGTSWQTVGTAGFSAGQASHISLALDGSGTPYLAYLDSGNSSRATVKKFDGSTWQTVGTAGFSAGAASYLSLALDGSGTPYVAFEDWATSHKATVMKLNGSSWQIVGTAGFSEGSVNYTSLALDGSGTPYVAYKDVVNGDKATVKKLNGTVWETVGTVGLSAGSIYFTSLALDGSGIPYVAYTDGGNSNKATVKKFDSTNVNGNLGTSINYLATSNGVYMASTTIGAKGALSLNSVSLTVNTTWTGTSWSSGTPSATVEAIIDGTYSTGTDGAFTAKKLTINTGQSLTINSGTTVTVQNELISNGSTVVENNANLIQVNNVANTGNITVKRNSSPLLRLDYTLWSSPVANQNLAAFSPLTTLQNTSRFYTYDTANYQYSNTIDPTTTDFTPGTGYLIRMPNTADAGNPTAYAGQFTGVPNNGDISFSLSTAGYGYNLVGNPYPSPISMSQFVADNSAYITGTLYFWRKTNGIGTAYCTWTGGVFTTNSNLQSVDPAGIIQTGQGFFVKANASGSVTFKNGQRSTNTVGQFFRTRQLATPSRIWLNATNTAGGFSQMAVNYTEAATQGVDNFDGIYINDSPLALTSNINNDDYTIQGRPAFDVSDVVPLNFKTDVAGDYTIAIDHVDGLFAEGQDVYLVDTSTGAETNLKTDAYTFIATAGTANSRFSLKYQKTLKVDTPAFNENSVTVYKNNGTLFVNSRANAIGNIKVFDIQGRLIAEQKNVNSNTTSIKNIKANRQVLIVKVTAQDNTIVNKKVVN